MSNPVNDDDANTAESLTPAARELEAALSRLRPAPDVIVDDAVAGNRAGLVYRDKLMFRAGEAAGEQKERAAARRQLWAWRGAAAVLAAISIAISARGKTQSRNLVEVVYVHDTPPPAQNGVAGPASREATELPAQRKYGRAGRDPDPSVTATPASPWMGVRGDYLSTRAAVLRWGVAALPRVDESTPEGSTLTPLDEVKKLFWHKNDGGRL
jgi:hypothetical protein